MRVLVIDNYDSFTYNLVQYLGELGADIETVRNDKATVDELLAGGYERCVISPGPCTPDQAGISLEVARRLPEAGIPTLGVCLGHQAIGQAFGARVVAAMTLMHGKVSAIRHGGAELFEGLPDPFIATRYHSLAVAREGLPDCLEVTAWTDDGEIMGLKHRSRPIHGVQFHPESIATEGGHRLLANFLDVAGVARPAMA